MAQHAAGWKGRCSRILAKAGIRRGRAKRLAKQGAVRGSKAAMQEGRAAVREGFKQVAVGSSALRADAIGRKGATATATAAASADGNMDTGENRIRMLITAGSVLLISLAIVLSAYPFLADAYAAHLAKGNFSRMTETFASAEVSDEVSEALRQAYAYNRQLAGYDGGLRSIVGYRDQLELDGTGIMSWLEIPKLSLLVPIYKGCGEEVLAAGGGHVESSSLPVGGQSSNCAITAHSGMHDRRMFDDLESLGEQDRLVLWTLGVPFAYRICSMELVDPTATDVVGITPGSDRVTLITCRPIGVNSQRLIVTAERTEYRPEELQFDPIATYVHPRTLLFLLALLLLVFLIWLLIMLACRRYRRREDNGATDEIAADRVRDTAG